ncbi:hypothetical protein ABPG75_002417 [Micractinium tetrahymenae]
MEGLRKLGEKLESAAGLPHSPRSAAAKSKAAAAGTPEWATSEHYPGPAAAPRVYPDDTAALPPKAEAAPKHRIDLNKMSPRAQAIMQEVGHELEESTHIIT